MQRANAAKPSIHVNRSTKYSRPPCGAALRVLWRGNAHGVQPLTTSQEILALDVGGGRPVRIIIMYLSGGRTRSLPPPPLVLILAVCLCYIMPPGGIMQHRHTASINTSGGGGIDRVRPPEKARPPESAPRLLRSHGTYRKFNSNTGFAEFLSLPRLRGRRR